MLTQSFSPGFPRPRGTGGGRAPQIGPGTFEFRSDSGTDKPSDFKAMGWTSGPQPPSTEMWCYLDDQSSGSSFQAIGPTGSATHNLWADRVGSEEAFEPPPNATDDQLRAAFKGYVSERYRSKHGVTFPVNAWKVQVGRPYNYSPSVAPPPRKIVPNGGGGTETAALYGIKQVDYSLGETAWVHVSGYREIWVHYRPGELDGFCFPGTTDPRTGSTMFNTRLRFALVDHVPLILGSYLQAIQSLKTKIIQRQGLNPQFTNFDNYVVHDFRVEEP